LPKLGRGYLNRVKLMQPMWLHWAPRLRVPAAMVVGQVVYFC